MANVASAIELTTDTYDAETGGKTVFIKFFAPWYVYTKRWLVVVFVVSCVLMCHGVLTIPVSFFLHPVYKQLIYHTKQLHLIIIIGVVIVKK